MKKYVYLLLVTLLLGACATQKQETPAPYSQRMVESHGLADFYCNRHYQAKLDTTGWDYVSGLVANAVLKAWTMYPEKTEYYDAVKAFADHNTNADGSMILNKKGKSALRPSNIDELHAGNIYFTLNNEEMRKCNTADAERYRRADTLISNTHKYNHHGLFMGSPIYAQWQHTFGADSLENDAQSWSDIALQFKTIHKYTYNPEKQLNYHAWSATPDAPDSFWANQEEPFKGCSKEFWARGMGWYFAALVDVLEFMPREHPDRAAVDSILQQVAAGVARWQDKESGVWYQLMQYDATMKGDGQGDTVDGKTYNVGTNPNYLEASASSIFTYAFLKGMRLGLLDKATYMPVAEKAYQGLLKTFIREREGRTDIIQVCASAGLGPAKNPSRTGTTNYYLCGKDVTVVENEGKAIGTFIMASVEYEDMQRQAK